MLGGWAVRVHLQTDVTWREGICMFKDQTRQKNVRIWTCRPNKQYRRCALLCLIRTISLFPPVSVSNINISYILSRRHGVWGWWEQDWWFSVICQCVCVCVCVCDRGELKGVHDCYQLTFPCNPKTNWLKGYEHECMEVLLGVHVRMANICHMEEGLHLNYCEWGKCAMYLCRLFGSNAICLNLHSRA